ncbi:DBC1/CARP1 catalytically inactive NUDIX hydrolase domain [Dillenia turbinata]|uniref:DBC1/CARP1 catalytically inactive NUDIX hydrolase domain n=1 Tax=Dillenia turbinata TaxID=194707 RepID=A0AAN8UI69_9MAGN
MFSRGGNAYGQQSYAGQSAYSQNLGPGYSSSSVGGPDGGSQLSMASRHSSMLVASQEADVGGYRGHHSSAANYGGQYASMYGSTALGSAQQVPTIGVKGGGTSALESRGGYATVRAESPKFSAGDYVSSSSHLYGSKSDHLFSEKVSDYPSVDRRQYERHGGLMGRDLQSDSSGRYADSVGYGHQHQPEMYDRIDQASLLRQEQMLKAQSIQSSSIDASGRPSDYLAARSATISRPSQDIMTYGGRMDADPRNLSVLSNSTYGAQHAPSILGAAPRRNADDLMYSQSSVNPGYGVSLPPGRDYGAGKGLRGSSLEPDYPSSMLSHGSHSRVDDRKEDRGGYLRELELREVEHRRELLRERERERDREREKERERERERERDRERQRERERERERVRERERFLERRDKDRERERKREPEIRQDRTPLRISKDRHGSSLTKEARPARQDSPHREASHRRPSPVKEKRREYVCKVYSSSLLDVERDYLSIDKRYPRLYISPDFSKVVVNWPRRDLKLSMHTPVSFEHDFVEEDTAPEKNEPSSKLLADAVKLEQGNTIWNAKMILMSGLSRNAIEELSSEKAHDDRIPHICNILRFALLRKNNSFTAIGGRWESVDGGDPSVDESALVQTLLRYARDTHVDLEICKHWNPFLEIHYDRVGKDGLFSHKEVTVLFVPDLSECLPSFEKWRDEWLAFKKAISEREHQLFLKRERARQRKEEVKDKETDPLKDKEKVGKLEGTKESESSGQALDASKKGKNSNDSKKTAVEKGGHGNDQKEGPETGHKGNLVAKKDEGETASTQPTSSKPLKKKIIRKVVKQKVSDKKSASEVSTEKQNDKVDEKDAENNMAKSEVSGQQDEKMVDASTIKTFVRKKVIKRVPVTKTQEKNEDALESTVKTEGASSNEDPSSKSDSGAVAAAPNSGVKTTIKKKVIKRVAKKKTNGMKVKDGGSESKTDGAKDENDLVEGGTEIEGKGKQNIETDYQVSDVNNSGQKATPKAKSHTSTMETKDVSAEAKRQEVKKEELRSNEKSGSGVKQEDDADNQKTSVNNGKRERAKGEKEIKEEPRSKSNKDHLKEKIKHEEAPRHPGFVMKTKSIKDCKLRSLSLSLDSLLDYTDKDIDESNLELSLFAESFYEMLQHQMGCRILSFLEKVRIKFVTKRNQHKRQREETKKESVGKSDTKRLKGDEPSAEVKSKTERADATDTAAEKSAEPKVGETTLKKTDNVDAKLDDETYDEDPEEDPEEDEEMHDTGPDHDSPSESGFLIQNKDTRMADDDTKPSKIEGTEKNGAEDSVQENDGMQSVQTKPGSDAQMPTEEDAKHETEEKETTDTKKATVDKELLQAWKLLSGFSIGTEWVSSSDFQIASFSSLQVEDMRLIMHSLGKFLSHRDVKELVQSALLESNTGRDDRILYNKLVRMSVY